MILYHYWRSSCSWRVRWALNHKQLPHKLVHIDILKKEHRLPEFLKKNPSGFVPVLEWRGRFFGESQAMLEGLEEAFPHAPLLPNDTHSRMRVRQLAFGVIAGIQPLQNMSVLEKLSSNLDVRKEWASYHIRKGLRVFESQLEQVNPGTYCMGGQPTFADLALIPQCYNALRYGVDLGEFPLIARIYDHCLSTDACKQAAPEAHKPS